jgi:hypothetical protein
MAIKFLNTVQVDTDVLYVDASSNNVGIGTTSPSTKLHVSGGDIRIDDTEQLQFGAGGVRINNDAAGRMYQRAPLGFYWETNGGYRMVLNSSGNVGIGTTSPSARLEVQGTNSNTQAALKVTDSGDSFFEVVPDNNTTFKIGDLDAVGDEAMIVGTFSDITFSKGGTTTMILDSNNRVGIGTTTPRTKLHVSGLTGDDDPSLGSSTAPLFVSNTANSYGLNIGVNNVGASWLQAQSNTSAIAYEMSLNPLGGDVGVGTISPSEKLEVNGSVKATASTDAYKGYIKQSIFSSAIEKSSTSNYNLIPYNTLTTTTSDQNYNRMVAAYDGRIKKVYIRNTGGNTPDATVVNIKRQVNNVTSSTVYSATVTGSGVDMSAVYNFADNDFTFSEGDSFGILYQTTDSGGAARAMGGVAVNIIIEYNIT